MTDPKLTPEQYAQIVEQNKPHLIRIEEEVEKVSDGSIEVRIEVRQGVVNKMTFVDSRYWFKQKLDTSTSSGR